MFATETLALGINMPARSVVIDKLSKWNGETHADVTPGEYTQLTGRAGRRGIDVEGHAVVVWAPGFDPQGGRRPRLDPYVSAAVVVPAVVQHGRQPGAAVRPRHARASCSSRRSPSSRPTGRSSGWPGRCASADEALAGYARRHRCDRGDFMEYAALRRALSDRESTLAARGATTVARRPQSRWTGSGSATSSRSRPGAGPASPS